jgi:hypothetical protein
VLIRAWTAVLLPILLRLYNHNGQCCKCRFTVPSSGPLRRVALLSCGGQQRPPNSRVRPNWRRSGI